MSADPDRITITLDELNAAAEPTVPALTPVTPSSSVSHSPNKKLWLVGAAGAALVIVLSAILAISALNRSQSVERWTQQEAARINAELSNSSDAKHYIEHIHPLVTYKDASLKSIHATTVNGSTRAGAYGENISEVDFVVTYHWEGPVEKNGFTEVRYVFDMQGHQLKHTEYLDSNAVMNLNNIDWFGLGWKLAPLFFGGN